MKVIAICIVFMIITAEIDLFARECFPQQSFSYSPDGRYSILWREPTGGESHSLTIWDGKTKKEFFQFNRYVCVCWEPTGEHFALTDYLGSNVSEAYVYSSNGPMKTVEILDIIPSEVRKLYEDNHHSYVEVLSWTKAGLVVHLWGYGDGSPMGFDKSLRCVEKNAIWHCTEQKD